MGDLEWRENVRVRGERSESPVEELGLFVLYFRQLHARLRVLARGHYGSADVRMRERGDKHANIGYV